MKILSVIIPTYNMSEYIEQALNSLITDRIEELDILVINDGSKDDSSDKAKQIAKNYPGSIRVIDKNNGNYGSCINRGLKEAVGKYVKILDADDHFDNNCFTEYIDLLKRQDCDIVINDYLEVNNQDKTLKSHTYDEIPQRKDLLLANLIEEIPSERIAMHAVAFKLNLLRTIEYTQTEGISYTDDEWIFSPWGFADTLYYTRLPVYRYLVGRIGQTVDTQILHRRIDQLYTVLQSTTSYYIKHQTEITSFGQQYLTKRLERGYVNLFLRYLMGGNKFASFHPNKVLEKLQTDLPELYNYLIEKRLFIARIIPVKYFVEFQNKNSFSIKLHMLKIWIKTSSRLHQVLGIHSS
ncbi:MAG: glycosyltransferase family 2 protein [Barnesiella sp.]|nr:glycosyltransferase family 2 protein [Barnesiella sp.]